MFYCYLSKPVAFVDAKQQVGNDVTIYNKGQAPDKLGNYTGVLFKILDELISQISKPRSCLWYDYNVIYRVLFYAHNIGELYVDNQGVLYFCVASGTPGTWKTVQLG